MEDATLLFKLENETQSCKEIHTGHNEQLLNENDQVSYASLAGFCSTS